MLMAVLQVSFWALALATDNAPIRSTRQKDDLIVKLRSVFSWTSWRGKPGDRQRLDGLTTLIVHEPYPRSRGRKIFPGRAVSLSTTGPLMSGGRHPPCLTSKGDRDVLEPDPRSPRPRRPPGRARRPDENLHTRLRSPT